MNLETYYENLMKLKDAGMFLAGYNIIDSEVFKEFFPDASKWTVEKKQGYYQVSQQYEKVNFISSFTEAEMPVPVSTTPINVNIMALTGQEVVVTLDDVSFTATYLGDSLLRIKTDKEEVTVQL